MKIGGLSSTQQLRRVLAEFRSKQIDFLPRIEAEGYKSVLLIYNAAKVIGVENDILEAQYQYEVKRCKEELEGEGSEGGVVLELSALADEKYRVTRDLCDLEIFPIDKELCRIKRDDEERYTSELESLFFQYHQLVDEECSKLLTNYHEGIVKDSRAERIKVCTSVVKNKLSHLVLERNKTNLIFREKLFSDWNICLRLATDNIFQKGIDKVYNTPSILNATLDIYPEGDSEIRNRVTLQFHFIYPGARSPISHIQYSFKNNEELERLVTFYTVLYEMIVSEIKSIVISAGY